MRRRTQQTICQLTIFALAIAVLSAGCSPAVRYNVLSFFFDGVPAPPGVTPKPVKETRRVSKWGDIRMQEDRPKVQSSTVSHEPAQRCANCHVRDPRTGAPILRKPAPNLCYGCHTNYSMAKGYVHGPVAYGACLFCHEPHTSENPGLIKFPQPDLCYQCHEDVSINASEAHQDIPEGKCTICHEVHVASARMLLK